MHWEALRHVRYPVMTQIDLFFDMNYFAAIAVSFHHIIILWIIAPKGQR
jgi:hypothetical protein